MKPGDVVIVTEDYVSLIDSETIVLSGTQLIVQSVDDTSDDPDSSGDFFVIAADWLGTLVAVDSTALTPMTDPDRYHDAVEGIVTGFRYELCEECGHDLDRHAIVPGPLNLPFAQCLITDEEIIDEEDE